MCLSVVCCVNHLYIYIKKKLSDKALKRKIKEMYPEIFNGLEKLTEVHHIHIKENATLVIHPPRKIPVAL